MRNKIQAPGKQVLHKQVPKAQAIQKEKDPRLVAVGGFGQGTAHIFIIAHLFVYVNISRSGPQNPPLGSCRSVRP